MDLANLDKLWFLDLSKVRNVVGRPLVEFDLGEDARVGDGASGGSFADDAVCGLASKMAA